MNVANANNKHDELLELFKTSNDEQAHLRRALHIMFPSEYISLYHLSEAAYPSGLLRFEPQNDYQTKLLVSTEPSSRNQVIKTTRRLDSILNAKRAKSVVLCPIRRSIYDQCFDELIRQVTIGCVERGLLLYRIRNELKMTMDSYKRVYESAVAYGISKALKYEISQEEREESENDYCKQTSEQEPKEQATSPSSPTEDRDFKEILDEIHGYYRAELCKKDSIIERQRSIIDALNENLVDQIKIPI